MPYYRQACAKLSHVGIVFTHWSKNGFFTLQGQHVAPVLNFIFIATGMWEYSLQNCQNSNFGHKFASHSCTRL